MTVGTEKLWFETETAALVDLEHAHRTAQRCPVCLGGARPSRIRQAELPLGTQVHVDRSLGPEEIVVGAPWHVPFGSKVPAKADLRRELCSAVRQLEAGHGTVLAGEFAGRRPANADIENLLIYNINADGSAFAAASRHGIRFELDPDPPGRDVVEYRYRLAAAGAPWRHWQDEGDVASWTHAEVVGGLRTERRADVVWWTVRRALRATGECAQEPYAVRVTLAAPAGHQSAARADQADLRRRDLGAARTRAHCRPGAFLDVSGSNPRSARGRRSRATHDPGHRTARAHACRARGRERVRRSVGARRPPLCGGRADRRRIRRPALVDRGPGEPCP